MIELQSSGLVVVGTWNAVEGPNFTRWHIDEEIFSQESLFNKTLIVSTAVVSIS